MTGSATLNADVLVDDLVETVDELRGDLHTDFGIRAFTLTMVTRTWTGTITGDGDYADVAVVISPQPKVEQWDGYKWVLMAAGAHEDGQIRVSEVSLSYTYAQLAGANLAENQQVFYRLAEAHGQGQPERILRLEKPPFTDREKTIGWILWMVDMNIPDGS